MLIVGIKGKSNAALWVHRNLYSPGVVNGTGKREMNFDYCQIKIFKTLYRKYLNEAPPLDKPPL